MTDTTTKPVRLSKQSALDLWDSLPENQPIALRPLESDHEGSSYAEDSIRITGSQEFINSCLSNLKGLLEYDSGNSRLEIIYTQTSKRYKDETTGKIVTGELTGAYAFYVKAKSRGRGKPGPRKHHNEPSRPSQETLKRLPQAISKPAKEPKASIPIDALREVNAGLKLKAKPKPTVPVPVYGIGVKDEEEEDGYTWMEPVGEGTYPCDVYDTVPECHDQINILKKMPSMKKQDMGAIEITIGKGGKLIFKEV